MTATTPTTNLTHAECAARAQTVSVQSYRVELDLARAADPDVDSYGSTTTIAFTSSGPETWVDLIADRVLGATLNGEPVDVSTYDGARLPVTGLAPDNELVVRAECAYSRTGEGLHRFTDPVDGATYLYTHFEPTDARRVFANFEQPDLKGAFTFVVTAPADWEIVSGQPEASRTTDGSGALATVTFAPTPPLSTYITAVAAGPYRRFGDTWSVRRADGSAQEIELGVLCRASMVEHFDHEALLEVTRQGLDFFDAAFGYPYPWGKYDQVFVPEYNIGAMENPGLVTFTEQYLPRGKATRPHLMGRASTILHEMAHMWFGDLVTMRWWDGLWLKESFADLMGWHVAAEATEFTDAWTRFASDRKTFAYRQDQLPTTHPVVARVDDLEAARQNFDGITYAKGASALKQLMAYVGQEAFFAGARRYFADHAFGNTEFEDLLAALEGASGRDLSGWAGAWLELAGISELEPFPERGADGVLTRLVIRHTAVELSSGERIDRPHRLVVGLYELVDDRLVRTARIEQDVVGEMTEVPEAAGHRADLVLLNDDDLTYAKVHLDPHSAAVVRDHLASIESPLTRGLLWSIAWNSLRDGNLPPREFLRALPQVLAEQDASIVATALGTAAQAVEVYAPAEQRDELRAHLVATARSGLAQAPAGSDLQKVWAQALIGATATCADGVPDLRGLLDGSRVPEGLDVDDDLRWSARRALAAQDAIALVDLDAALADDDTMTGRTFYLRAVASRPGAAARRQTWERATTDESVTNDQLRALVAGFAEPAGAAAAAEYAEAYFASLTGWWESRSMTMATILVNGLFPRADLAEGALRRPVEHPVVVAGKEWLAAHEEAPAALRRLVVDHVDLALRALVAQQSARLAAAEEGSQG
ncbi:aminopeptidase N [Ornithinicoccus hortensis]|uniref:aminopeptidase N n=1 Tax=Ornithinicoccus hortensis TaxID=82346 RepID=UPI001E2BB934|nr:aminopeptidase N [Ornithinicoccus hortensis]